MANFESIKLEYSADDLGQPLYARICWKKDAQQNTPKPAVIVTHMGGLVVGSADIVPKAQIGYLCERNCLLVIPNYRLAPQVTAVTSFGDVDMAYEWTLKTLPSLLESQYGVKIDTAKIGAYGHSVGGTMALHLASRGSANIKAATALYPSLYNPDKSSSSYTPYTKPPFGIAPDFVPIDEDWASITPSTHQVSEAALALPGTPAPPRNRWQLTLIKKGALMKTVQPDGNPEMDPTTRFSKVGSDWPPTVFVDPENDDIPGSGSELIKKAVTDLKSSGAKSVEVVPVPGQTHAFDIVPTIGTSDLDYKWDSVKKGMDFLVKHLQS